MTPFGIFIILVFLFTLISKRVERTVLTAPLLFTLAGMAIYGLEPQSALAEMDSETVLFIAEATLALLLFTDATHIDLRKLLKETVLPTRLLGIGMPLTIFAGAIFALLVFRDFPIWGAALLAVILAPTDAGLGQVIVQSKRVPDRIRQALSVEAGLNDGLSMPFFALFVGPAVATGPIFIPGNWVLYTLKQIVFGILAGLAIGWLGGWLLGEAGRRDWVDEPLQQLGLLALALASYGGAGLIFLEHETHLAYQDIILSTVAATVLVSIVAHGLTALPGTKWYASHAKKFSEEAPELKEIVSVASD